MRKLASIQKVLDIIPHNNADKLEICKILGWTLCVNKGQFKKDDLVVYIEPDAILPPGRPEWEFMRDRGFRIKTIRLRGVISQGLVFPLDILMQPFDYEVGDDVTEYLGITKYEPYVPAQLQGQVKGSFPEFLHKTDEIRIQAEPTILENHKDKLFYISEKVDGSSTTYYFYNGEFGVCSRNLELKEDDNNTYWKVAKDLDLKSRLSTLDGNFSIQGELVGQGIQGNKYKLDKVKLFVFNAFDIDKGRYLCYTQFKEVIQKLGLETVPIVEEEFSLLNQTVESLVAKSNGSSKLNSLTPREGLVFRPLQECYSVELRGRLSFKVINPSFLLKYDSE